MDSFDGCNVWVDGSLVGSPRRRMPAAVYQLLSTSYYLHQAAVTLGLINSYRISVLTVRTANSIPYGRYVSDPKTRLLFKFRQRRSSRLLLFSLLTLHPAAPVELVH